MLNIFVSCFTIDLALYKTRVEKMGWSKKVIIPKYFEPIVLKGKVERRQRTPGNRCKTTLQKLLG